MTNRLKPLILSLVLGCLPVCAADGRMTPDERTRILNCLEESRKEFLSAIDGITEQQWRWKPAPDRWSVSEVSEHIVLAEAALFNNVKKVISSSANPAWEERTKSTLNGYHWLIYAPLHTMRYGKQIAEVKATVGYPSKLPRGKLSIMLFMVIERFKDGNARPVGERFRHSGRMLPEGVAYRASWVDSAGARCFQVMEELTRPTLH